MLSKGSKCPPITTAQKLALIRQLPDLAMVSVGSGNGVFEYEVKKRLSGRRLVCVDPDPEGFSPYPGHGRYLAPDYPFVSDLLANEPALAENCSVLLYWTQHSGIPYDMEAVRDLRPRAIFAYYEPVGGAGSAVFHYWLRNRVGGKPLPTAYDYGPRTAEMKFQSARSDESILPEGYVAGESILSENQEARKLRGLSDVPMIATQLSFLAKAFCAALIFRRPA